MKARNIPEVEHQVGTLQGVTTSAEFSRAISSLEDLQTEVLEPLLAGAEIEGVKMSTTRKKMSLTATWTIAWEDASTARNAQVDANQRAEPPASVAATSAVKTADEAQKVLEEEGRAPKRVKPGEFSSRVRDLTTAGATIDTKLIQGCDEVLARMKFGR